MAEIKCPVCQGKMGADPAYGNGAQPFNSSAVKKPAWFMPAEQSASVGTQ